MRRIIQTTLVLLLLQAIPFAQDTPTDSTDTATSTATLTRDASALTLLSQCAGVMGVPGPGFGLYAQGQLTASDPRGFSGALVVNANALGNPMDQAHEGSHVADGSAWVASGFSAAMNPTRFQTELRAYRVSATIGEGLYIISFVAFRTQRYTLAVRNWDPANTDKAIRNILRSEYPNLQLKAFQRNTKGGH